MNLRNDSYLTNYVWFFVKTYSKAAIVADLLFEYSLNYPDTTREVDQMVEKTGVFNSIEDCLSFIRAIRTDIRAKIKGMTQEERILVFSDDNELDNYFKSFFESIESNPKYTKYLRKEWKTNVDRL